jgi:hypothetical protein
MTAEDNPRADGRQAGSRPRQHRAGAASFSDRPLSVIGTAAPRYPSDAPPINFGLKAKKLKLIDGCLRRALDPAMEVEVEVLDVNEEEARALLLSIDPLAMLAQTQAQLHERLPELTPAAPELEAAWRQAADRWPKAWSWARRGASSLSV